MSAAGGTTATHDTRDRRGTRDNAEASDDSAPTARIDTLDELQLEPPSVDAQSTGEPSTAPSAHTFDEPIRWGDVELTEVAWQPAGPDPQVEASAGEDEDTASGSTGELIGGIRRPFLTGEVSVAVGACGTPTGRFDLDAQLVLAGHALATVTLQTEVVDGTAPLPTTHFDGTTLSVMPPTPSLATIEPTPAAAIATTRGQDGAVAIEVGRVGDLPPEIAALFTGASAGLHGEPATLAPPIVEAIEAITGQVIGGLQFITDALLTQTNTPVGAATVEGDAIYFGPGRYSPDSGEGLELIARAISAALAGIQGLVDAVAEDPTSEESESPGAAPPAAEPDAAPEAPDLPAADTPAVDEEPLPGDAESAAPVAEDGAAGDGAGEGEAPMDLTVELIIPPAPAEPTPAHRGSIGRVRNRAADAQGQAQDVPAASASTEDARAAAVIPASESLGRAQQDVATALEQQIEPSPEIIKLCNGIRDSIRKKRPVDEDELLNADLREPAAAAGESLNTSVQDQGDAVGDSYQAVDEPPTTEEPRPPTAPGVPDASIGSPNLTAPGAAPPPIESNDLQLTDDEAQLTAKVDQSGIHTPVTAEIPDGSFAQAREGQQELGDLSASRPAEVEAQQQAAIATSQEQMAELQRQALNAFNASRSENITDTSGQQTSMAETEQQTRDRLSSEANAVFVQASGQVRTQLTPLTSTAMSMWRADVAILTTDFRTQLDAVKRWVDERHSGVGGSIVAAWDNLTGYPSWITRAYDRAEREFADGVCDSLTRISVHVNTVIAAVEGIISTAEEQIRRIYTENLPEGLESWAAEQLSGFEGRIAELRSDVEDTRTGFLRDVSREAISAVQTVQAEVEALREEAKGLIGKVVDALAEFIEDPVTAIINGLLRLVGIPPASFWALIEKIQQVIGDIAEDPINFINNLVDAVRTGFEGFFERFPTHLIAGFWDWLFSGLGDAGVAMPADFSLNSLVTFALELMGLSWQAIREILVRHIGEENVELVEQAWELLSLLIEKGIDGVLDMIREHLDPATILQSILDAAVEYLVTTLIAVVAEKVVMLLNPVGIVAQAIMLIWDVLSWIFNNAARLFRFIETIVNGIADIVAGNISAMATAVEEALASLIPVVIDFLAQLLRLGGLPDAVADVIRGLREVVLQAVDAAIGFLVGQARAVLEALGFGGADGGADSDTPENEDDPDDTELGTEVRFNAEGEAHRHWIDNQGSQAVLMVASNPMSVADKLSEWSGKVSELAEDDQGSATSLIGQARQLHDQADGAADDLAAVYAAAAAGQNDTDGDGDNDNPPSDAAVESTQRQLAGLLDQLFTLFAQESDLATTYAAEIGRMHTLGQVDAREDIAAIEEGVAAGISSWDQLRAHLESHGLRVSAAHSQPTHAGPSAFARFAEQATLDAGGDAFTENRLRARKRYLVDGNGDDPYAGMVAALQGALWMNANPTSALQAGLESLLDNEVDPELLIAVGTGRAGLVAFLQALSQGDNVRGFTKTNFTPDVWRRKANKDLVTSRFRPGGVHEWIPTNMIPQVINATRTGFDALEWDDWVQMQDEMRTDTTWLIFDPINYRTGTAVVGSRSETALTGHVGAVYHAVPGRPTNRALTTGQGPWHDELRAAFTPESPTATIEGMKNVASRTIWAGTGVTPEGGVAGLQFPGPYFQSQTPSGGQGQSTQQLATAIRTERAELLAQFERWKGTYSV